MPCSPVILECPWEKTQIEKNKKIKKIEKVKIIVPLKY